MAGREGMAEGWGTQGGAFLVHSELSIPSLTWLSCLHLVIASEGSSFLAGVFASCCGEKLKVFETQGPLERPGQAPSDISRPKVLGLARQRVCPREC